MADSGDLLTTADLLEKIAAELTKGIRTYALGAGWPKHIADSLEVYVTDFGEFDVRSPYGEEAIYDLEHGRPGQPPKSVIGNYLHSQETIRKAEEKVSDEIEDYLARFVEDSMEMRG